MRYNGKNRRFPAEGGGKYMKLDNYVDIKVFRFCLLLFRSSGCRRDSFRGKRRQNALFGIRARARNARKLRRLASPRYQGARPAQRPAADRFQPQRQPYHDGHQRGRRGVYARLSDQGQGTNAVFHRNLHCRTRHCRKIPRQFRGTCGGHLPRGAFAAFRGCELSFR